MANPPVPRLAPVEPVMSTDTEVNVNTAKPQKEESMWETTKLHISTGFGELIGTTMFLFLAEGAAKTAMLGRTAAELNTGAPLDATTVLVVSTAFGLSLMVTAWIFFRVTGGLFNPAITFSLWLVGVLTGVRAIILFVAQLIGGIIAAALVLALTPAGSAGVNVVNNTLTDVSIAQGFFLEALGTSFLIFTVLLLAVEKHRATFMAPVGIGLALFGIQLFLTPWTGCAVNPSRAFGPAVVSGNFPGYHWIYWIGPLFGSLLSVTYYQILKLLKYNSAVLAIDGDKEVVGLRPVHQRLFKRLRGDKDWRQDRHQVNLSILHRRQRRRAERKMRRDAAEAVAAQHRRGDQTDDEGGLSPVPRHGNLSPVSNDTLHMPPNTAAAHPKVEHTDAAYMA